MEESRQRIIIQVFRKYSHSLGPDAVDFLEQMLQENEIQDEDLEWTVELVAKEYNKQDDAQMKVSVDILRRVYSALQDGGVSSTTDREALDPDSHLYFIDAFDMPSWHWSTERGTFERGSVNPSSESRVMAARDRLNIIRQSVLRNEHFAPSTIPSKDRDKLVTLKSTKHLLGRPGERFLLLGMLSHSKEGKLCLEDADGTVELDFSKLDHPSEGLFVDGSFTLVEGEYTEEATLEVIAISSPPCESRETARSIFGHIDFLGKGATSLIEDAQFSTHIKTDLPDLPFFFFSDVWLDHPLTFLGLQKIFDNCIGNDFIPKVMVLCGNFTSKSIAHGSSQEVQRYQDNFDQLADLISSYPRITRETHFVFVPGPLDMTVNSILPRRPLLSSLVSRLKAKVPRVHFATNPCRIKFFHQEIVIFRDDLMSRILRNIVGVKPDVSGEDLKKYLILTILDQSHLSPFTLNIQPTISEHDHALRLYPLPTAVVLADRYDAFKATYTGCHVFNPGRFIGKSFTFSAYRPAEVNSEECVVKMDDDE